MSYAVGFMYLLLWRHATTVIVKTSLYAYRTEFIIYVTVFLQGFFFEVTGFTVNFLCSWAFSVNSIC